MDTYNTLHIVDPPIVFEVDSETFWESHRQIAFPRYHIQNGVKENIVANWRAFINDSKQIRNSFAYSTILKRKVMEKDIDDPAMKILNPRSKFNSILALKKHLFGDELNYLVALLERYGVNAKNIGVRGSLLVDFATAASDIDVLVYGSKDVESFFDNLKDFYKARGINTLTKHKEITNELYKRRHNHLGRITKKYFLLHERRRIQGIVLGKTRFVFSFIDTQPLSYLKNVKNITPLGEVILTGEVINSKSTYYDPAAIEVKAREIKAAKLFGNDTQTQIPGDVRNTPMHATIYGDPICGVTFFDTEVIRIKGMLEQTVDSDGAISYHMAIRPSDAGQKQVKILKSVDKFLW